MNDQSSHESAQEGPCVNPCGPGSPVKLPRSSINGISTLLGALSHNTTTRRASLENKNIKELDNFIGGLAIGAEGLKFQLVQQLSNVVGRVVTDFDHLHEHLHQALTEKRYWDSEAGRYLDYLISLFELLEIPEGEPGMSSARKEIIRLKKLDVREPFATPDGSKQLSEIRFQLFPDAGNASQSHSKVLDEIQRLKTIELIPSHSYQLLENMLHEIHWKLTGTFANELGHIDLAKSISRELGKLQKQCKDPAHDAITDMAKAGSPPRRLYHNQDDPESVEYFFNDQQLKNKYIDLIDPVPLGEIHERYRAFVNSRGYVPAPMSVFKSEVLRKRDLLERRGVFLLSSPTGHYPEFKFVGDTTVEVSHTDAVCRWLKCLVTDYSINAMNMEMVYKAYATHANQNKEYTLPAKSFYDWLKSHPEILKEFGLDYRRYSGGWRLRTLEFTHNPIPEVSPELAEMSGIPPMNIGFDPASPKGDYNGLTVTDGGGKVIRTANLSDHELQTLELIIFTNNVEPNHASRHITSLTEQGLIECIPGHAGNLVSSANQGVSTGSLGRYLPTELGLQIYNDIRAHFYNEEPIVAGDTNEVTDPQTATNGYYGLPQRIPFCCVPGCPEIAAFDVQEAGPELEVYGGHCCYEHLEQIKAPLSDAVVHHIKNDIELFMDGNAWTANFKDGYTHMMECPTGFGDTPALAVDSLIKKTEELIANNQNVAPSSTSSINTCTDPGDVNDHVSKVAAVRSNPAMIEAEGSSDK